MSKRVGELFDPKAVAAASDEDFAKAILDFPAGSLTYKHACDRRTDELKTICQPTAANATIV